MSSSFMPATLTQFPGSAIASGVLCRERLFGELVKAHLLAARELLAREQKPRGAVFGAERAQEHGAEQLSDDRGVVEVLRADHESREWLPRDGRLAHHELDALERLLDAAAARIGAIHRRQEHLVEEWPGVPHHRREITHAARELAERRRPAMAPVL